MHQPEYLKEEVDARCDDPYVYRKTCYCRVEAAAATFLQENLFLFYNSSR